MTYSTEDVLEIIKNYNVNIINVHEHNQDDDLASVGVSVISDEIMGSGGTSDPVQSAALKRVNNGLFFSEIATDIRYLEQRLERITSERNAQVVSLTMQGYSSRDVGEIIGVTKMTVGRLLRIAAQEINGKCY